MALLCHVSVSRLIMNFEDSLELNRRLASMSDVGLAPGTAGFMPIRPPDGHSVLRPDYRSGGYVELGDDLLPTVEEMESVLVPDVSGMSSEQCLRAMIQQNNVLLRVAIGRRKAHCGGSSTGRSGSLRSSLTTTGSSSGRVSGRSSADGASSPFKVKKPSPPKVFECPLCHRVFNEKDFDRHIFSWNSKIAKSGPVRSGVCPGIRDVNHPLLRHYPYGTPSQRVACLVQYLRSLVHPGAYDAMSAEGSGRHVIVAERVAALLSDP